MNEHRSQCFVQQLDLAKLPKLDGKRKIIFWDAETVGFSCVNVLNALKISTCL